MCAYDCKRVLATTERGTFEAGGHFQKGRHGNITALLGQDEHYDVYAVEQEKGQPGKHFDVGVHRER